MSKTQHTPGRLEVCLSRQSDGLPNGHMLCDLTTGDEVATIPESEPPELFANTARRLAACWNACDGLNPEAVPDLIKALEGVVRVADRDTVEFTAARAALTKAKAQP